MTFGPFVGTLLIGMLLGYAVGVESNKRAFIALAIGVTLSLPLGLLVDYANARLGH